jgi:hypothetical protein
MGSVDNLNMIVAAIKIKIGITVIFSTGVLVITSVSLSHYLPGRESVGAIKKKTSAQSVVR